jgi:IS5 family transposase
MIKRQFGHAKMRFRRGLAKNTSQLQVIFVLSNLWMDLKVLFAEQQKRVVSASGVMVKMDGRNRLI